MVENRSNIVLLVNDHQAFYGHHGIKRPHFDRLAAEGTRFTNAYCASPLCSPSRKTMLTGLYPHNHGQTDNSFETPIDSSQTYLDILKDHGYDNYYFGKWHASEGTPSDLGCWFVILI
ncbi:sulfatase-like hydrolase/transferase [Bacillus sp. SD088]|uniref:sulfatase-like hydrolase/transferase n=1 Tax=Bacillus sp. SD088 TaxID=2782012 RepID=UPI001A973142|nr:sulfatase-like hydrolase/transferase [Bacillus sp. SD088]MBO0995658.1 sulfatase-like hydrolase/transferase [Bacillus sp. SD088]